jgi:hypothetical protein
VFCHQRCLNQAEVYYTYTWTICTFFSLAGYLLLAVQECCDRCYRLHCQANTEKKTRPLLCARIAAAVWCHLWLWECASVNLTRQILHTPQPLDISMSKSQLHNRESKPRPSGLERSASTKCATASIACSLKKLLPHCPLSHDCTHNKEWLLPNVLINRAALLELYKYNTNCRKTLLVCKEQCYKKQACIYDVDEHRRISCTEWSETWWSFTVTAFCLCLGMSLGRSKKPRKVNSRFPQSCECVSRNWNFFSHYYGYVHQFGTDVFLAVVKIL